MCKCGYNMSFSRVLVYDDKLNGNIFCDVEYKCPECLETKYLRCPMEVVLGARCEKDYHPCLCRRDVLFDSKPLNSV